MMFYTVESGLNKEYKIKYTDIYVTTLFIQLHSNTGKNREHEMSLSVSVCGCLSTANNNLVLSKWGTRS